MAVSSDASRAGDVGRTLGGRYRLVAPLGSGASATVYLAQDLLLARQVAVKLLHPALAGDASFLRRFRAEAQAAAALSHPNIVAVYDWGNDTAQGAEGAPYLVTEYLGGGSLRAMLDRGRRLTPSQALLVGLEACRGLEYAHARGLVHRDVKPANLLFGEDGRLRIADFGLARAIAEAAWTEPAGVVLGTARYASPEQAKGQPVDGHTDVYSLALTLIEAVTGTVPFAADTTVATLMGRIDKLMPVSAELGQLAPVLERAGRPQPSERSDAAELAQGLVQAARLLPRPTPLPLVTPSAFELDLSPTSMSPPTALNPGDGPPPVGVGPAPRTAATPVVAAAADGAAPVSVGPFDVPSAATGGPAPDASAVAASAVAASTAAASPTAASPVTSGRAGDDPPVPAAAPRHRPRRLLAVLAVAVLAGLVAVGVLLLQPSGPTSFAVDDYRGQPVDVVQNQIGTRWLVDAKERTDEEREVGIVVDQAPTGGTLAKGGTLTLWVSKGPAMRALPEVTGRSQQDASAALAQLGLTAKVVAEKFDEDAPKGNVLAWVVAEHPEYKVGTEVTRGTEVQLTLSKGPEPRTRPSLLNMTWDQAKAALDQLQLVAARQPDEFSETVPAGVVIRAEPQAGLKVERGSAVNVWISLGPQLFDVPNLVGMTIEDAKAAIVNGGIFTPGSVTGPITGTVVAASPGAGEKHRRGTPIDLTLGAPPA